MSLTSSRRPFFAYESATEPGYQVSRSGGWAEVRYVGSWVRNVSEATVLSVALAPPRLLKPATRSSIAFFACGEERFDWRVTGPPPEEVLVLGPEVTHPLISAAAPTAPVPARNRLRLGTELIMEELPG